MKKLIVLLLSLALFTLTACSGKGGQPLDLIPDGFNGLAVNFLSVGESDAIFIKLPNGKTILIDSGEYDKNNSSYISTVLSRYANGIDYLILSNPADKHLGNALSITQNYRVGKAFIPYIKDRSVFIRFNQVYERLLADGVNLTVSDYSCSIDEDGCFVGFLAPLPYGVDGSAYNDLALSTQIDSAKIYSVSAVVYLEYSGVRFLFTSDASEKTETLIKEKYQSGLYDLSFGTGKVDLDSIDFLKVANHGSNNGTSSEFLSLIKPFNAVISVGENYYGHPSSAVIERLQSANPESSLYRTDIDGTITVLVNPNGEYIVKTVN